MPAGGVDLTPPHKLLSTEEIIRIAQLFVSQGVNKIRLTGGEPTVRKDIVELIGISIFHFYCKNRKNKRQFSNT
jgi:molybdenum cofactor biosynthesis enzyme MoaA